MITKKMQEKIELSLVNLIFCLNCSNLLKYSNTSNCSRTYLKIKLIAKGYLFRFKKNIRLQYSMVKKLKNRKIY